jgi:phospholipid/cholesterol/gamma-HCH transport system substrate-binding protein
MGAEENKRAVMVGVFVLLAIAILVVGIFTLAGRQNRFVQAITLRAVFDDVAGLRVGNNVWFSGVRVGTVREIRFTGASQVEISMRIEERVQEFIRQDAIARITSEGVVGPRIIDISGGSPQAAPVADGDLLEAENPLNTDDVLETLQRNNENLLAITSDFREISARIVRGEGPVGTLLSDTSMADDMRSMVASLQQTSANTVRASQELSRFTALLNTDGGLAHELATDTVVFNRLQSAVVQLQQASSSAAALTNNLREASTQLQTTNNPAGMMLQDEQFANRLRSTLQNVESGMGRFEENMEALQHVWPFRRGIRKIDRQTAAQ